MNSIGHEILSAPLRRTFGYVIEILTIIKYCYVVIHFRSNIVDRAVVFSMYISKQKSKRKKE